MEDPLNGRVVGEPDPTTAGALNASRKRLWLGVYVDFLVFTALWEPLSWLLGMAGTTFRLVGFAVFAVVRSGVVRGLGDTPGRLALGIQNSNRGPVVGHGLTVRERWWTMLAGVLLVLEGSKNLVRWTQGLTPPPFFGVRLDDAPAFALISALGLANVAAGLQILRMRPTGALIGVGVIGAELVSLLSGGSALRTWIAERQVERRALQGVPTRDGCKFLEPFSLPAPRAPGDRPRRGGGDGVEHASVPMDAQRCPGIAQYCGTGFARAAVSFPDIGVSLRRRLRTGIPTQNG